MPTDQSSIALAYLLDEEVEPPYTIYPLSWSLLWMTLNKEEKTRDLTKRLQRQGLHVLTSKYIACTSLLALKGNMNILSWCASVVLLRGILSRPRRKKM